MRSSQAVLRIATAATILVAATACSSSKSTGPTAQAITSENAPIVAAEAQQGVDLALGGLTSGAIDVNPNDIASGGFGFLSVKHPLQSRALSYQVAAFSKLAQLRAHAQQAGDCPTVTTGTGDSIFTFTAGSCTTVADNDTVIASGVVTLQDPTLTGSSIGYGIAFDNFYVHEGLGGTEDVTLTMNGSRTLAGTTSSISLNDMWAWGLTFQADTGSATTVTLADSLQLAFTSTGGAIDFTSGALPAGTLAITGPLTIQASHAGVSYDYALVFSTPTVLVYDPTCSTENGIVGGELQVAGSSAAGAAAVDITFHTCGTAPTVVFVAGG